MILPSREAVRLAALLTAGAIGGAVVPVLGLACVAALGVLVLLVLREGLALPHDPLSLERHLPPRVSHGVFEPLREQVTSRAVFPLVVRLAQASGGELEVEPRLSSPLSLAPRGAAVFEFRLRAPRRGERTLPRPVARWGRPGGLAERQGPIGAPLAVKVSPDVARLRRYDALRQARALQALGLHRSRYAGLGEEFDHLRQHGREDDFRRIDWKATARRGVPMARVVRQERGQTVILAVDASHWMGLAAGERSRLDLAVDAALFLAHVALDSGDQVGLAVFASDLLRFVPPSSHPGQARRLLEALATLEAQPVHVSYRNLARALLARRLRRSLVVVFTEPPDATGGEEAARALGALAPRHLPLAVSLADPAEAAAAAAEPQDALGLSRRLAAGELIAEREALLARLERRGVRCLNARPDELSPAVVNRYLELKSRGAL